MNIQTTKKLYIGILIVLLVLQSLWFFVPWGFAYRDGSEAALNWLGANSIFSHQASVIIGNSFSALYIVAYLGLLFLKSWARNLLLSLSLAGALAIPLYGLSIESGYEAMMGYLLTLGEGFVLALVYFSPLRQIFVEERS